MKSPALTPTCLADQIAKQMMGDIITNRRFQRYWIQELQEIMKLEHQINQHQNTLTVTFLSTKQIELDEIEVALQQLVNGLQLATETFLRSLRLAETSNKFSNESATLYSVRIQLDRFVMSDKFVHSKFLFISRRLTYLIKMFTIRVSNVFDTASMAFYACTLCDMLYRLEEFTSIHCPTKKGLYLQQTTDEFHSNVAKRLNMFFSKPNLFRSRPAQSVKVTTLGRSSSLSHAQTNSTGLTVAFRQSYTGNRPKSFILPADLEEQRYRLRKNPAFQRALTTNRLSNTAPTQKYPKNPAHQTNAVNQEEIERRWTKLMHDDKVLQKSTKGTPDERNALRLACEITKEVAEELEKRVNIV